MKLLMRFYVSRERINVVSFVQGITALQEVKTAGHQWLTPVILATQEVEIRRMAVQSQLQATSL
jgi:hypothetical protein